MYLNRIELLGYLGHDAEISVTPNGTKKASFSISTSKKYKDANGEEKTITYWHNVVAWRGLADVIERFKLTKGTALYVEGELTNREIVSKTGDKKRIYEVLCSSFQVLPSGIKQSAPAQQTAQKNNVPLAWNSQQSTAVEDDDIPF